MEITKEVKETRNRRNANGDGSRWKRVYKNGKVKWLGYVTLGFDESTGKQIKQHFKGDSEREIIIQRDEYRRKINDKVNILAIRNKTAADFINEYLENFLQYSLEQQSYLLYSSYYRLYIKDSVFGKLQFENVETRHLQIFISELAKKGFVSKTIKNIFIPVKLAFRYAINENYISKNPCVNLKFPKAEQKEFQTLNAEQVKILINNSIKHEYHLAYRILMHGLRISELLGIRWCDVSFTNRTISINKQIFFETGKEATLIDLKTDSSRRTIPISSELVELLKAYKEKQEKRQKLSDNPKEFNKLNLVFCTKKGKAIRQYTFRDSFHRMLKKLGLPIIRVHDSRHSFCTNALNSGMNIKRVAKLAGHSNILQLLAMFMQTWKNKEMI